MIVWHCNDIIIKLFFCIFICWILNMVGLVGLWCLTPLSTVFQLYRGGLVLLLEETTDLSQVPDKLYHIILYRVVNPTTIRSQPRRPLILNMQNSVRHRRKSSIPNIQEYFWIYIIVWKYTLRQKLSTTLYFYRYIFLHQYC